MQIINKIWKGIKSLGKAAVHNKRNIGIGVLLVNQGLKVFFPELMTPEQSEYVNGIGLTLSGIGLGHHGVNKVNKAINNAKSVQNK